MARNSKAKPKAKQAIPKEINPRLTMRQEEALAALIESHGSSNAAAKKCSVSQQTIWRYLQDPIFAEEFERHRQQWKENLLAVAHARALKGDRTLLIFLLKSIEPEVYDDNIRKAKWERTDFAQNKDKFVLPPIEINIIPKCETDYESAMVGCRGDPGSTN